MDFHLWKLNILLRLCNDVILYRFYLCSKRDRTFCNLFKDVFYKRFQKIVSCLLNHNKSSIKVEHFKVIAINDVLILETGNYSNSKKDGNLKKKNSNKIFYILLRLCKYNIISMNFISVNFWFSFKKNPWITD